MQPMTDIVRPRVAQDAALGALRAIIEAVETGQIVIESYQAHVYESIGKSTLDVTLVRSVPTAERKPNS